MKALNTQSIGIRIQYTWTNYFFFKILNSLLCRTYFLLPGDILKPLPEWILTNHQIFVSNFVLGVSFETFLIASRDKYARILVLILISGIFARLHFCLSMYQMGVVKAKHYYNYAENLISLICWCLGGSWVFHWMQQTYILKLTDLPRTGEHSFETCSLFDCWKPERHRLTSRFCAFSLANRPGKSTVDGTSKLMILRNLRQHPVFVFFSKLRFAFYPAQHAFFILFSLINKTLFVHCRKLWILSF